MRRLEGEKVLSSSDMFSGGFVVYRDKRARLKRNSKGVIARSKIGELEGAVT